MRAKEFIVEAGTREGALNTCIQLKRAIENSQGMAPHEVDLLKRQMNALMRKYNIRPEELSPPNQQRTQQSPPPPGKNPSTGPNNTSRRNFMRGLGAAALAGAAGYQIGKGSKSQPTQKTDDFRVISRNPISLEIKLALDDATLDRTSYRILKEKNYSDQYIIDFIRALRQEKTNSSAMLLTKFNVYPASLDKILASAEKHNLTLADLASNNKYVGSTSTPGPESQNSSIIKSALQDGTLDQDSYKWLKDQKYNDQYIVDFINTLRRDHTTSIARLKKYNLTPADLQTIQPPVKPPPTDYYKPPVKQPPTQPPVKPLPTDS